MTPNEAGNIKPFFLFKIQMQVCLNAKRYFQIRLINL